MTGGLHIVNRYENLTSESTLKIVELSKKFDLHMNGILYNQAKAATYLSIEEFVKIIEQINNSTILKQLLNACLGIQKISEITPVRYRSMMYIIDAQISKLENNISQSLSKLHEALLCCPIDDVMTSIVYFLKKFEFHETIIQTLIDDVRSIKIHFDQTRSIDLINSIMIDNQLPDMTLSGNGLKSTPQLNMIRKYERAIIKQMKNDHMKAALYYIDLSMAVKDLTCIISNFLLAGLHFYELMKQTSEPSKIYAYRNIIIELTIEAFYLSRRYLPLHMQIYMFKIAFSLVIKSTQLLQVQMKSKQQSSNDQSSTHLLITKQHKIILTELLKDIILLTRMSPLSQVPLSRSYDLLYIEVVGQELLSMFLINSANSESGTLYKSYLYQYYVFEGVWHQWIRNETFDSARFNCMQSLLSRESWTMIDVQNLLNWSRLRRTIDGWLPSETYPLNLDRQTQFKKVNGISFNINTGEIKFLFQVVQSKDYGLFDVDDIQEVLKKGITSSLFTLDQPNIEFQSHPFQEMRYAPKSLSNTNFLSTLLHADYLLKMISTGVEICSEPPFQMRDASDGFMKRLPEWLQEQLKPIDQRKDCVIMNSVHRFWIEAGEITYEHEFDENNNIITYYLGDVPMCVKKQLMQYDEQGNLIDDLSKTDEDHSPEGEFAQAFTCYYDEIGSYFPELLRLKELLKLGVLLLFIRSTFHNIQKYINNITIDVDPIDDYLQRLRNQINYPRATSYEVDHIVNSLLSEKDISYSDVPYRQMNELKTKIRSQLIEVDEDNLSQITEAICEACHCSYKKFMVKGLISNWLQYNQKLELVSCITDSLKTYKQEQYLKVLETIVCMGVNLDKDTQFNLNNSPTNCSWVPAVFCSQKKNGLRIYGGVSLEINLKAGTVEKNNQQTVEIDAGNMMNITGKQQQGTSVSNRSGGTSNRNGNQGGNIGGSANGPCDPPDNGSSREREPKRTEPANLNEQIALKAAKAGDPTAKILPIELTDSNYPSTSGWVKMQYFHEDTGINIHYVKNTKTGEEADFKFKNKPKDK
ncbi:unnamed protein product [Rotaria sp. Silwood1]|nr:unnamed protein product [Rotaria sp. Silwood1]CAF4876676.1 unnamed protein product [Rotaria sp. Silwood1]